MNNEEIIEDRKAWHNLEAQLSKEESPNICQECKKGLILPAMISDRDNDEVYYWGECNNPDCRYTVA
jgi:hypothetical protein